MKERHRKPDIRASKSSGRVIRDTRGVSGIRSVSYTAATRCTTEVSGLTSLQAFAEGPHWKKKETNRQSPTDALRHANEDGQEQTTNARTESFWLASPTCREQR